jgi:hypothetical protein
MTSNSKLDYKILTEFITENVVVPFYATRFERLHAIQLKNVLKRKNPYLFKAKNIQTAEELVRQVLDAYLSSREETIFGDYLEQLSIHVCGLVYGGRKSGIRGIDLEFEKDGISYLVAIKSGPNWANSDQIEKMKINFRTAKRTLGTSGSTTNVVAVNGCCYGKDNNPEKDEYLKLCGQRYWEFISGDENLYLEMIKPLGQQAKEKDEEFGEEYARKINEMTQQMLNDFCTDGLIDWPKLLTYTSGK